MTPIRTIRAWLAVLLVALLCGSAAAEDGVPVYLQVSPASFGLEVPPGAIVPAKDVVTTHDEQQEPVVGRLHVKVGPYGIVLLPDGRLVVRRPDEFSPTDRPFEPLKPAEVGKQIVERELPGFRVKKTRHYAYVYNTSENFALATSRILESMIPGMLAHARSQRIDADSPEVPLVAIMFRTEAEFQAYRRMPPGVLAYYHTVTNRIVMYEEAAIGQLKPQLAIQQAISTIAHEGAHQILHNIGVQQRLSLWPMWISEGLAEYYAPTTFGKKLKWKGSGQVNDMRMFELELFLKSREASHDPGTMIDNTVQAARLTSTGYASAWSLTHYLARMKRDRFNAYLRDLSQIGPLQTIGEVLPNGRVPDNLTLFHQHFGEDLEDLEKRLVRHLNGLPYTDPFAEWPHFVATIMMPGRRRPERAANLFHTPELARKWIDERLELVDAGQRSEASSQIRTFPNRLLAEQFARRWMASGR